jgi:sugar phosphate isomerase/epimerase
MKYSFMTFSCPELNMSEVLALAKRFGYDGIEPRVEDNQKHGVEVNASPEKRREVKQQAIDSGIAICCVLRLSFSPTPIQRSRTLIMR